MPTYQYVCTVCGEQLEVVQSFSDEPLTVCPHCEGRLRKQFSSVGVVFKGSGFYRTDSRAGGGSVSSANAGSTSGKQESSGESKPAAKSESSSSPASKPTAKSEPAA